MNRSHFSNAATRGSRTHGRWDRAGVERLEARRLLAALPAAPTATGSETKVAGSMALVVPQSLGVAPQVTAQPQGQRVLDGTPVSFTASASGSPAPSVQWQISVDGGATFINILGANAATFSLTPATVADDGHLFRAVFTNASGSATTNAAALAVVTFGQLVFAQQPTGSTPGWPVSPSVIVNVEDPSGNILTGDTSVVSLSLASGPTGGTLEGTTSIVAVGGVATFTNLSLPIPGVYTLQADDGFLTTATSAAITSAGSGALPLMAIVQQPSATPFGSPISPAIVVDVEDAPGHIMSSDNSLVTLSIATGPAGGTLGGTVSVHAVNGVATFTNVVPSAAGSYTLLATDAAGPSITSQPFLVRSGMTTISTSTTRLASDANPAADGSAIVFTATVAGAGPGTPTGAVQFFDNGLSLGTRPLLVNGTATFVVADALAGKHSMTATYLGDSAFAPSTSPLLVESVGALGLNGSSLVATVTQGSAMTFVPGNTGTASITIQNQGTDLARGVVGIQLFAAPSGIAANGTTLPVQPAQLAINLKPGASKAITISFIIPDNLGLGNYTLGAVLSPISGLTADNISAAGAAASATISLSFGTVATRRGITLSRTEPDGTIVIYRLSGPGTGTLSGDGITRPTLTLTGTTAATAVTITAHGASGKLTLGGISSASAVGSINAPAATLSGILNVSGAVGKLVLDSLTGSNLAAAGFGSVLIEGSVASSRLLAGTNFGADGAPGGGDDSFNAGKIGSLRVLGSVTGSVLAAGLNPVDGVYLNGNDVLIPGGQIGAVQIIGTLSADSRVLAAILPRSAVIAHAAIATATDPRFRF